MTDGVPLDLLSDERHAGTLSKSCIILFSDDTGTGTTTSVPQNLREIYRWFVPGETRPNVSNLKSRRPGVDGGIPVATDL